MKTNLFCWAFMAFLFLNCSVDSSDSLVGEYAEKPDGTASIRISKQGDDYMVEMIDRGVWSQKRKLDTPSQEVLETYFGKDMVQHIDAALMAEDVFGVLKIDDDFELAGDKVGSEYLGMLLFPFPIYKL